MSDRIPPFQCLRMQRLLALLSIALASPAALVFAADTKPANQSSDRSVEKSVKSGTMETGRGLVPEQAAVQFDQADLSFKLDPKQRTLAGDATLTFSARQSVGTPLDALVVDLDPRYTVERVEANGTQLARQAWRNTDGRMRVQLPEPLSAGQRARLRIVYAGKPHVAKRPPWDGGFVWSKAPTGEPWIATAVQGEGCDLFWPCIDHPLGEPLEVLQHITVPAPLVAAGNGVAEGVDEHADESGKGWRTYHWRARQPNTYAIALNVGPYEELQATYQSHYGNAIPLRFWYLRGDRAKAEDLFAELPLMLQFFEEKIGPFPFADEKMGVVETPHLGMEHQTINAYGNDYRKDENGYDWLLQHEFAHEWFGNQLTNREWGDMWLHEGFGSYMQPLYLQWLRGDMEYMAALMKQRATIANNFPVVPREGVTGDEIYGGSQGPGLDIYYKGSLILHTLRNLVGDKVFFEATRRLVYGTDDPRPGNFKPRYGTTREFVDAVNELSGRDYGWFFDTYLRSAKLPELVAARAGDRLQLRWRTEGDKPFPMPVEVRVGERVMDVPMKNGRGSVRIPEGASYTLDPHSKVLRELPHIAVFQADKKAREAAGKSSEKRPGQ